MDQAVTWVREHLLVVTLVLTLVVVAPAAFAAERVSHPALVRAADGSARRAVLVMVCFHAALLLCWGVVVLAAMAVERETAERAATLWVTLPAIVLLSPWSLLMVPRPARLPVDDYLKIGASTRVARALALTASPFAIAELMIAMGAIMRALG